MSPLPFDPVTVYGLRAFSIPLERPSWSTLERSLDLASAPKAEYPPTWINKCVYQCRLCGERRGALRHLQSHRCFKKRVNCFVRTITNMHRCKVCREQVVCDEDSLERHFKDKHAAASLRDYVAYVNIMVKAASSYYSSEEAEEDASAISSVSQPLASSQTQARKTSKKKPIRCALCGETFSRHGQAAAHMASVHVSVANADDCITETSFTTCLLCDAKVTDDDQGIGKHLAAKHKTTRILYQNVFARSLKTRLKKT